MGLAMSSLGFFHLEMIRPKFKYTCPPFLSKNKLHQPKKLLCFKKQSKKSRTKEYRGAMGKESIEMGKQNDRWAAGMAND